jgi:CRP-like cAMP-binding protein
MTDITKALNELPWLTGKGRAALAPHAELRSIPKHTPVNPPDTERWLSFVAHGAVKVAHRDAAGHQSALTVSSVGELVDGGIARREDEGVFYVALESNTSLLQLSRAEVIDFIAEEPDLARRFIDELLRSFRDASDRLVDLSMSPARRRVARMLLNLAERFGHERGEVVRIPLALSRRDIADLGAMAQETAIRVMSALTQAGVLQTDRRGIDLLDLRRLRRIAEGEE